MSNMPDELKEAFAVLGKYQYQPPFENDWDDFSYVDRYKNYKFRVRREKPLTVEEALKLEEICIPCLSSYAQAFYNVLTTHDEPLRRKLYAEKGLAYATQKGAIAHAQMWLDMKVEE